MPPLRKPYSPHDAAHDLFRALTAVQDSINGGFGAIKHPLPCVLRFLQHEAAAGNRSAHTTLNHALDAMLASDLYDPLDGSFFRATLTADWRVFVPEKPLGVNALLALTLLAYNRRIARRVVAISQEVQSIGAGNLYLQLEPKGRDEISQLTASVEQMRLSLLRKTSEEQRALQQNSDLITAMSHDIRNPLTSLIGYLDLLEMQQAQLPEDLRRYVLASRDKAYQLKDLTGEMFRYFLVFSRGEQETHPEPYDAQILCAQLLGECAEELRSRGFDVNLLLLGTPCTVTTDAQMLKRVTDNLLSNIEKYADPAARLTILAEREGERLHVCFANRARRELARVESNHIGLRTCAAILKLLGGEFVTHRDGEAFTAEFTLPVTPQSET